MSWLKNALNRAAEAAGAGGKSFVPKIGRARNFAGAVVFTAGSAVAGGARAVLERASLKNYNNFKHAVKRLNEVSGSVRGQERTEALSRWVSALKELKSISQTAIDSLDSPVTDQDLVPADGATESPEILPSSQSKVASVLFYDPDTSDEPLTFRDVFLRSNALENITLSLIEDGPSDEEIELVLELFSLCLSGGPEVHHAVVSGLQDLSKAMDGYSEIMVKRGDLLNMVAMAITGLKLNAEDERVVTEAERVDAELRLRLEKSSSEQKSEVQGREEWQEVLHLSSMSLGLAQHQEKQIQHLEANLVDVAGDTEQSRKAKVEKMKRVAEELKENNKLNKSKITESRKHKSDALAYRITKAQEMQEAEKLIAVEMHGLQKRREELQAELDQVLAAISVQTNKHLQLQEEKEQFDEASTNVVAHLSIQEDELTTLVAQHGIEASLAATWSSFLEDTWLLQSTCQENKETAVREAVKVRQAQFWKVVTSFLTHEKESVEKNLLLLGLSLERISSIRKEVENSSADVDVNEAAAMDSTILELEAEAEKLRGSVNEAFEDVDLAKSLVANVVASIPSSAGEKDNVEELFASLDSFLSRFKAMAPLNIDENAEGEKEV